jgi:hypothetical protein
VWVVVFGTLVALAPNAAAVKVTQPARARTAVAEAGD